MNNLSSFFGNLGKFWQSGPNYRLVRFNIILIASQIILIIWFFKDLPPEIPLYFSRPWGEAWLAPATLIVLLPLFSIFVALINYFLALFYYQKKALLSKLLVVFSFIISLFSTISIIQIFRLIS